MVVATSAEFVIVIRRPGRSLVQRGSVPPAGQLVPEVVEVTALVSLWSPVPGLLTVTL